MSRKDKREEDYYSAPVQEIMGTVPSWITRWGVTAIAGIFAIIVLGCWLIRYPETVDAEVTLTSSDPPSDLTARYDGLLDTVCVISGDNVAKGQLIALLSTPAVYVDVLAVEAVADSLLSDPGCVRRMFPDPNLRLGDLQDVWSSLVRECSDYRTWLEEDQAGERMHLLRGQLRKTEEYNAGVRSQKEVLEEDMKYERRSVERDSALHAKGLISDEEYEGTLKSLLSKRNTMVTYDASLTNLEIGLLQLEQQIRELEMQRRSEEAQYCRTVRQQAAVMKARAEAWKDQYAIVSPMAGTVSLQSVWSRGQHVGVGELIASVVPDGGSEIMGRASVPSVGFGKVRTGQEVNVRLNGFPYMEFGVLKGRVSSISAVPQKVTGSEGSTISYTVDIVFPNGLKTTYGRELPMVQQMDGTAEIITEDRRLIERFIDPVISLFRN